MNVSGVMQVEYQFDKALLKRAYIAWIKRTMKPFFVFVALVVVVCWVILPLLYWAGFTTSLDYSLLFFPFLLALLPFTSYWTLQRNSKAMLNKLTNPTLVLSFSEEGLTYALDSNSSQVQWRYLEKLWTFKEVWLLFVSGNCYYPIPLEVLSDEIKQFIQKKLKENNIPIK